MNYTPIEEAWGAPTSVQSGKHKVALFNTLKHPLLQKTEPKEDHVVDEDIVIDPKTSQKPRFSIDRLQKALDSLYQTHGLYGIMSVLPTPCVSKMRKSLESPMFDIEELARLVLIGVVVFVLMDIAVV